MSNFFLPNEYLYLAKNNKDKIRIYLGTFKYLFGIC